MTTESIAARLRDVRTIAEISAYRVDRLAGLTVGHTAAIERGEKRNIEVRTLARLADVLGFDLHWLIMGTKRAPARAKVRAAVAAARVRFAQLAERTPETA